MDIKEASRFLYEMFVLFVCDFDRTIEVIGIGSGFDLDDNLSMLQLKMCLNNANGITNGIKSNYDYNTNNFKDEKSINDFIEFTNEFHRLTEEGLEINPMIKKKFK